MFSFVDFHSWIRISNISQMFLPSWRFNLSIEYIMTAFSILLQKSGKHCNPRIHKKWAKTHFLQKWNGRLNTELNGVAELKKDFIFSTWNQKITNPLFSRFIVSCSGSRPASAAPWRYCRMWTKYVEREKHAMSHAACNTTGLPNSLFLSKVCRLQQV